jgi:hypothetical protein
MGNPYLYELPDVVVFFVEYHDFVLACTSEQLLARAFGKAFNQYLEHFAYIAFVGGFGELVL